MYLLHVGVVTKSSHRVERNGDKSPITSHRGLNRRHSHRTSFSSSPNMCHETLLYVSQLADTCYVHRCSVTSSVPLHQTLLLVHVNERLRTRNLVQIHPHCTILRHSLLWHGKKLRHEKKIEDSTSESLKFLQKYFAA
jgi:hypothetical protein